MRIRRTHFAVAFAAALVIVVLSLGFTAEAAGASDASTELGVDGWVAHGAAASIKVTVTATDRLSGEIVVRTQGPAPLTMTEPIELAGATVKDFWVVVPTTLQFGPMPIEVLVEDGDEVVARATLQIRSAPDTEVVGVLPDLAARAGRLPATSDLAVDAGNARLGPLDPALLSLGPDALGGFDIVAATARDVASLSDGGRRALFIWLDRGGHLLLDDGDAGDAGLPEAWRPSAGATGISATAAGIGEVRETHGAAEAGRWREVLLPTPTNSGWQDGVFQGMDSDFGLPVTMTLTRDGGFRIPDIGGVVWTLVAYAVVAGPITFLVLRRMRRLSLGWFVIPALAIVTSVGLVATGASLRRNARTAHATIYEASPGGEAARSSVLLVSSGGGTRSVALPSGWGPAADVDFVGQPTATEVRLGADARLGKSLGPGQADVVNVSGPAAVSAGLVVDAESREDGVVTGTVRNDGAGQLRHVAAFTSGGAVLVGDLAAGEERSFEVTDGDGLRSRTNDVWSDDQLAVFGRAGMIPPQMAGNASGTGATPAVSLAMWSSYRRATGFNGDALGLVVAAGWTEDAAAPVVIAGGDAVEAGHTLVAARAVVAPAGDALSDMAVQTRLLRGVSMGPVDAGAPGFVMSFRLPPGTDATRPLVLSVPSWIRGVEVWDGTGWDEVAEGGAGDEVLAVEPGWLHDGSLFVRGAMRPDQFGAMDQPLLVREPRAGEPSFGEEAG